jgi:hypothetical protein
MAKIRHYFLKHDDGIVRVDQYLYWCEGCGWEHAFALVENGGHHHFNMDLNNPTITPSLLQNFNPEHICHSFIKDGNIQYLNDCWHHLKGQTVELLDVDEKDKERRESRNQNK